VDAAKRATAEGPVFITDRGRPAYALLRIEDYDRITGRREMSLLTLMDSLPCTDGIEFEPPRADIPLRPAEFD
jgi:prevent-host-death family protein